MWNKIIYRFTKLTVDGVYFDIDYKRKHYIRIRLL